MSDGGSQIIDRAAALRDAFDRSFTEPRPSDPPSSEDFVAIRIETEPHALRLAEIAGLYSDRNITPVPGRAPGLLGIAGFRGAIVPVYDLQALLGYRPIETARWLAIAASAPVALAFAVQEGHLRVARDAIIRDQSDAAARRHVREFVRTPDFVRAVVDVSSVLDAIRRQASATFDTGEG